MCVEIFDEANRKEISSIRELLEYVPMEFLVLHEGYVTPGESREETLNSMLDGCLCPINVPASFYGIKRWQVQFDDENSCWSVTSADELKQEGKAE